MRRKERRKEKRKLVKGRIGELKIDKRKMSYR
jgi:hypothetical protein